MGAYLSSIRKGIADSRVKRREDKTAGETMIKPA